MNFVLRLPVNLDNIPALLHDLGLQKTQEPYKKEQKNCKHFKKIAVHFFWFNTGIVNCTGDQRLIRNSCDYGISCAMGQYELQGLKIRRFKNDAGRRVKIEGVSWYDT